MINLYLFRLKCYRFFELLRTQYTFDQEKFVVTLGSGWNIPVDLIIGPHVGISYMTHPQAQPVRVTEFQQIERITTSVLPTDQNNHRSAKDANGSDACDGVQNGQKNKLNSPCMSKRSDKKATSSCSCYDIKTLLKIKVAGNSDDLTITCNGVKTAENIADLVDGYCRIVNQTEMSLWDRSYVRTPSNSAMNSLEKNQKYQMHGNSGPENIMSMSSISNPSGSLQNSLRTGSGHSLNNIAVSSITNVAGNSADGNIPILADDYVDIGMNEEEDNDYSTPAVRNYELDRAQITLNEIIGVGQFGDVHIGTCIVNKAQKKTSESTENTDSIHSDDNQSTTTEGAAEKSVIQVAVKTCKADADLLTCEKFLEEACKLSHREKNALFIRSRIKRLNGSINALNLFLTVQISCKSSNTRISFD